jgi:thiol-disulfide isomerase/thioredoxin
MQASEIHKYQCAVDRWALCLVLILVPVQIRDVSQEELEVALAERDRPMIIDFYADWCGPCILLADELKKVR